MQEFFSKWMENDIITKDGLETIKKRREDISCLFDVGRLAGNIKSNYSGYPVAQWKNLFSSVFRCPPQKPASLLAIFCFSMPSTLQILHY